MTAQDILKQVEGLNSAEKEKFYLEVMEGYFKSMMSNQRFMEGAFHKMGDYLVHMKEMGLDVNSVLNDMEAGIGMAKKAAVA